MNLTDEEREALVIARKARAFDTWEETKGIVECGYWHAAANRMYYACYYMTTALLIKNGFQASTHSGVIRLLGLHFVSTGIISKDLGRFYSKISIYRNDYQRQCDEKHSPWKQCISQHCLCPCQL